MLKWDTGGRKDLGKKRLKEILEMWSVRFQGHLSEVGYSLGFPSELAHLADECRAEQEV